MIDFYKKLTTHLFIFSTLCLVLSGCNDDGDEYFRFSSDLNFCIETEMRRSGFSDVSEINYLNCSGVASLDGIEALINLRGLRVDGLEGAPFDDMGSGVALPQLETLTLFCESCSNIDGLASLSMPNLLELSFDGNIDHIDWKVFNGLNSLETLRLSLWLSTVHLLSEGIELQRLQELRLSAFGVVDSLEFLEQLSAPSMQRLDIYSEKINAMPNLSQTNWSDLKSIDIAAELGTIQWMSDAALPNLVRLDLSYTGIESIEALLTTSLSSLEYFNLEGNKLTNTHGFQSLPAKTLQEINFSNNQIETLVGFENRSFESLSWLSLQNNMIDSLEGLSGMTYSGELRTFDFSDNKLTNLNGIGSLVNETIRSLDFSRNLIDDISALNGLSLPSLRGLYLYENKIDHVQDLGSTDFERLESLNLESNLIVDLSGLSGLKGDNLVDVALSNNPITTLSGLEGVYWPLLTSLAFHNTSLSSIDSFSQMSVPNLEAIDIVNSDLTQFDAELFSNFPRLKRVSARNSKIETVVGFEQNPIVQVESLDLSSNQIVNVSNLAHLSHSALQDLQLGNNVIADFAPLEALTFLRYLDLSVNDAIACSGYLSLEQALYDTDIYHSCD